ncbi:MAG TPA: MoxR family ATPase [Gemmatimonadaceae bacterium]|nr:MoxR family ATPase [Gemmatimonadaceae bacterium]
MAHATAPEAIAPLIAAVRREIARRVIGQDTVVDQILMAMAAGGHALLVGVPGLAKTLMIRTLADTMHLGFRRIQFTPDLVPSDITGTELLEEDAHGHRSFRFVRGPLFANIVLADEINRAPPRTQAALLEAMQEHSVTAGGETMRLPEPFFVLATQNPIEQEGTYPLPEAQLDRFLFDIRVGYPSASEEVEILRATTGRDSTPPAPVMEGDAVLAMQRGVRDVVVADTVLQYATALVRATRPDSADVPALLKQYVRWGAGPRAGQALVLGAKAAAFFDGRVAVSPDDIRRVAHPVLRHRVLPNFAAEADGVTSDPLVDALLAHVPAPSSRLSA